MEIVRLIAWSPFDVTANAWHLVRSNGLAREDAI
jgi:hypothetical protein